MPDSEPAGGDILVYSRIRDSETRDQLRHLLANLPGERINDNLYEVFTADWDDGAWDEEVDRMKEIINPATDTLLFWRAVDGKLLRTSLAGRFTQ